MDGMEEHLPTAVLETGLDHIRRSPADLGRIELIVARPAAGERKVLAEAELDPACGLAGDTWAMRGSSRTADGSAHPDMQLTLMNARAALLVAGAPDRRPLCGDQLYVDLDLSPDSLPAGTRLAMGTAVIEITAQPHTGCKKFAARFGIDALRFVNSRTGRSLRLRGVNCRVLVAGTVRAGEVIRKLPAAQLAAAAVSP
jgi:hypothetical protein